VSWPSLAAPGFVAQVTQSLQEDPAAARSLSIEWVESMRPKGWQVLAVATRPWRDLGAKIGVEHAGAAPQQLMQLHELGIDYIKIDSRHLRGIASDSATRAFAQSLVALVHGLNLQAVAEGVHQAADLEALWAIGFDAATGPAVTELSQPTPTY
jgi:EAL domain-containing protein (putative c-di-GMP-specific phosphodiesterase class I)